MIRVCLRRFKPHCRTKLSGGSAALLRLCGEIAGRAGDLTAQRLTFERIESTRNKQDL